MEMTPKDWEKVKVLFELALRQEPAARVSFLAQNCADNELRSNIEKLLSNLEEAPSFLSKPILSNGTPLLPQPTTHRPVRGDILGDRFGNRSMPSRRVPWWMYVLAAAFVAYFALRIYTDFSGPTLLGINGPPTEDERVDDRGLLVRTVAADSSAQRAGLRAMDRVAAVDGKAIHDLVEWRAFHAERKVGRPYHILVRRGVQQLEVVLMLERNYRQTDMAGWIGRGGQLVTLILALVIAFRRPHDPVARFGALFLAVVGTYSDPNDLVTAIWRQLPMPLGGLLWIQLISQTFLLPILFTFFAIFPSKLFRQQWPWIVIWAPVLPNSFWWVRDSFFQLYYPQRAWYFPQWVFVALGLSTLAYIAGGLVVLVLNYRRLVDVNERRRLRVLVAGSVIGWLSVLPSSVIGWLSLADKQAARVLPELGVARVLFVAFPLSFAYAILRHRLFDVRVMIRRSLQYAMARRVLLSVVPLLGVILLLDLGLHGDRPLMAILMSRGGVYAVLGGLALATYARRQRWLEALDRRFFRERYDAQRLLREVAEEVRQAGNFERVAPRVVARVEAALHPEFTALMVREPGGASFRTVASAPWGHAPPPLRADSKLIALLQVLGKPLEVQLSESGWLKRQLPNEETELLREARIELLVPIAAELVGDGLGLSARGHPDSAISANPSVPARAEAVLAMGVKRSEEPYSLEDEDLLLAIASSLALLLERQSVVPARVSEAFEECPLCGACYDSGMARCEREGSSLVVVRLPRTLGGRYQLERCRARGGMGAVYESLDTALERRVAVKVIRDDLVGSTDAAERFQREARAGASFTHPNVVTVHDFGVAGGTRGFLVMELLEGVTLREELKRQERLEALHTVQILRGVCEAVEVAHRRQLVHRDLKPENIFLARSEGAEIPKVLDFGIAKFLPTATQSTAETSTGVLIGTLHYMSPEQLKGEAIEAAWDLWALAVIAYEMLTGAQPFEGRTAAACHGTVLAGRFTPVVQHLPEASVRWQEFFARAFALEQPERPRSARMFFSELERTLAETQHDARRRIATP